MSDEEIIQSAYEDALKNLWKVFFTGSSGAKNDKTGKLIEERFLAGVALAKKTRDRALELLKV